MREIVCQTDGNGLGAYIFWIIREDCEA